jgi:MoaA/NifB/PqqE/SkfB family radical SAM enzyme
MADLAYIQVTRECNQKCRFCSNPPTKKKCSTNFFLKLIRYYIKKRYNGVVFSGGEPTLYAHLETLIEYARTKKFPARIITNGQNTADFSYALRLKNAGLEHACVSIFSDREATQAFLTQNKNSLKNIENTLNNFIQLGIRVDIATVISKYNADHLSRLVKWIVKKYPTINHFIWNNIDPHNNRVTLNKDTIPRLTDFELELSLAMTFLYENRKTFRAERVPLCYMADFVPCSTETRKLVKNEKRMTYFLDRKKIVLQKKWYHDKADCCKFCTLNDICAGLFQMDSYFSSKELYPLFLDRDTVIKNILNNKVTTI